jgi:transposase-like protein
MTSLQRAVIFCHKAVRAWEAKLSPALADELRRHGKGGSRGRHWHVDKTYLKVRGRWAYLYRATDRDGNLVDTILCGHRDMAAAQAFFRSATTTTDVTPERVTTDGHGSYPRAIRSTLGRRVVRRTSAYKNNRLEQGHRGVEDRLRNMLDFESFGSKIHFFRGYDELGIFSTFVIALCAADERRRAAIRGGGDVLDVKRYGFGPLDEKIAHHEQQRDVALEADCGLGPDDAQKQAHVIFADSRGLTLRVPSARTMRLSPRRTSSAHVGSSGPAARCSAPIAQTAWRIEAGLIGRAARASM